MDGIRPSQLIALLLVSCLPGVLTPLLAAEDAVILSAGCTLHDAVIAANTDAEAGACPAGSGADTIRSTADIRLERELPPIVSTVSIEGAGYSISGDDQFRIFQVESEGSFTIRDLSLTERFAERGGAIYLFDAQATLSQITVVNYSRIGTSGIFSEDYSGSGVIELSHSLIAGRSGCVILPNETMTQSVGNFIEDGSCDAHPQGDPLLSPFNALADTIAPQAGSPAIDAGDPDYCLPFDQLGRARPASAGCDIGAIEYALVQT